MLSKRLFRYTVCHIHGSVSNLPLFVYKYKMYILDYCAINSICNNTGKRG